MTVSRPNRKIHYRLPPVWVLLLKLRLSLIYVISPSIRSLGVAATGTDPKHVPLAVLAHQKIRWIDSGGRRMILMPVNCQARGGGTRFSIAVSIKEGGSFQKKYHSEVFGRNISRHCLKILHITSTCSSAWSVVLMFRKQIGTSWRQRDIIWVLTICVMIGGTENFFHKLWRGLMPEINVETVFLLNARCTWIGKLRSWITVSVE